MRKENPLIMDQKQFISIDWGTSNLRIRLVSTSDLKIMEELRFTKGVKALYQEWKECTQEREGFYLKYLEACLDQFQSNVDPKAPLVMSGMASSSIGLRELPYALVPFGTKGKGLHIEQLDAKLLSHPVFLISGVQTSSDVIRGEEVQMLGLVEKSDQLQLFILPGTHCKHILVRDEQVLDVKTYMTGELFDIIEKYSILSDSVHSGVMGDKETKAFVKGVEKACSGDSVLHTLFQTRTNSLFHTLSSTENYYFLSGLLIGEELRVLKAETHLHIKLCASGALSDLYSLAIEALGLLEHTEVIPKEQVDHATIKGQWIILNHFNK